MSPRRPPGPGPDLDDLDADLRGEPDDLLGDGEPPGAGEPIDAPLTAELDLHTFQPRECADVVAEYVRAAQEAGMTAVRIVHGKGTGTLRRIIHGVLDRHPAVHSYRLGDERGGSWGATLVELHPAAPRDLEPRG
jgi:dsDNA-specific endonuclease/ATPase MutS2